MKYEINLKNEIDPTLSYVLKILPPSICENLKRFLTENEYPVVNEIRIKKNSYIYLILNSSIVKTQIYVSKKDVEQTIYSLCGGSIYAHIDTIKDGYISVGKGVRAGICGTAVLEEKSITSIKDISSVNIRLPQKIHNASSYVFNIIEKSNFNSSILIYSPPGVGKTSILRDLILKFSCTSLRFSVIDSRQEIITPYLENINCDAYVSYPKGRAIELATRTMTPEYIICDEISSEDEADAIIKASHTGVKLIATTHASSFEEVINKRILSPLIESNVFDNYVGVKRKNGERKYEFSLKSTRDMAVL